MLKKTIEYEDFDGNKRKEDFYFNLTKAELADWLTVNGNYSLDKVVTSLVKAEKVKDVMNIFKDLIYMSYGEKSLDGRRFIKTTEVKQAFLETEAYSELYMELISSPKKAADFFNGIVPKDVAEEINKTMSDPSNVPEELKDYISVTKTDDAPTNVVPISN